jgi:transcription initiation factor TFIIH subunit 1
MGTSSEDVLLLVNNVKFKKSNGSLYVMAERVGWMSESADKFAFTHHYSEIKCEYCFWAWTMGTKMTKI